MIHFPIGTGARYPTLGRDGTGRGRPPAWGVATRRSGRGGRNGSSTASAAQGPSLRRVLTELKGALEVPSPARWPGASEPALERPDDVKFELTEFLTRREPGKSKLEQLENRFLKGPLSYLPEIDHWAMEEFFYHGFPGDSWHPIEAFLAHEGDRFIPAGQEQLRRWKKRASGFSCSAPSGTTWSICRSGTS